MFLPWIQRMQEVGPGILYAGFWKHFGEQDKRSFLKICKNSSYGFLKLERQFASKILKTTLVDAVGVFSCVWLIWYELQLFDKTDFGSGL